MGSLVWAVGVGLVWVAVAAGATERILLQNKGSDTLVNAAQAWAEAYARIKPGVAVAVSGGGSGTGIAALIAGTLDIANSSRALSDKELDLARQQGRQPREHIVGFDALALYLHPNNPLAGFTKAQLAGIYGRDGPIRHWADLGVSVPGCRAGKMVLVSRQNNSGTYAYFKEYLVGARGRLRLGTLDLHGSKDVVDLVAHTPCALGYSGLGYATAQVKLACVAATDAGPCVLPTLRATLERTYPISRPLFLYTDGEPQGAVKDYLDWIQSDTGQCILAAQGYAPVRELNCGGPAPASTRPANPGRALQ